MIADIKDLDSWWRAVTSEDLRRTRPKTAEYGGATTGSADLRLIGANLAELIGLHEGVSDAMRQELGCWFYAQGKLARLVSDYQQGRPGKPDTWFDATIYCMIARRLQAVGRWP